MIPSWLQFELCLTVFIWTYKEKMKRADETMRKSNEAVKRAEECNAQLEAGMQDIFGRLGNLQEGFNQTASKFASLTTMEESAGEEWARYARICVMASYTQNDIDIQRIALDRLRELCKENKDSVWASVPYVYEYTDAAAPIRKFLVEEVLKSQTSDGFQERLGTMGEEFQKEVREAAGLESK